MKQNLVKDLPSSTCLVGTIGYETSKPVMVSVVSSIPSGVNFIFCWNYPLLIPCAPAWPLASYGAFTQCCFLIATAIPLIATNGLQRTQCKCSHYATVTTSLTPMQPIMSKNKSQSQIAQCERALMPSCMPCMTCIPWGAGGSWCSPPQMALITVLHQANVHVYGPHHNQSHCIIYFKSLIGIKYWFYPNHPLKRPVLPKNRRNIKE